MATDATAEDFHETPRQQRVLDLASSPYMEFSAVIRTETLSLSLNGHRPEACEATMRLPLARTVERPTRIHEMKVSGALAFPIIVSRVGDDTAIDSDGRHGGGSVESRHVIHDVYGYPARRRLRDHLPSRRQVRTCEGCPLLP